MSLRTQRWLAAALIATAGGATLAAELTRPEGFPQQPLTIIVPRGQGGGSHQLSTAMADALEKAAGLRVEVVNRPGDDGREAIRYFLQQPPNGYTILQHVDDIASLHVRHPQEVNPLEDLIPLAITQLTFSQIYIRTLEDRFTDWSSLVEHMKTYPGEVKIAQVGEEESMEGEMISMLESALGVRTVPLPFDRPTDRYLALIKGDADALIEQPGDVAPFLERKLIKPVLTWLPRDQLPERFTGTAALDDVPGRQEVLYRFRGFFVHAGVPADRVRYLEQAFKLAFDSADFQEFNRSKYMDLLESYRGTEAARELIAETIATYRRLP